MKKILRKLAVPVALTASLISNPVNAEAAKNDYSIYGNVNVGYDLNSGNLGKVYPKGPEIGAGLLFNQNPIGLEARLSYHTSTANFRDSESYGFFASESVKESDNLEIVSAEANALLNVSKNLRLGVGGVFQNVVYNDDFYRAYNGFFSRGSESSRDSRAENYLGLQGFIDFIVPMKQSFWDFRIGYAQLTNQSTKQEIEELDYNGDDIKPVNHGQIRASAIYNFGMSK